MAKNSSKIKVYLEIGKKRTFAGAIDWPGWSRSGKGEAEALQALIDSGPRYTGVLQATQLEFQAPADVSAFSVVERLEGDATTDFGAPAAAPADDARPVDEAELDRLQALLKACWQAFDATTRAADGKELRKGLLGGGRDLEKIVQHVLAADADYLLRLGWKFKQREGDDTNEELSRTRQAILEALASAAHGELPAQGPWGSPHWTARYFVRRVAWHVLDHAWEIEERMR